MSIIYSNPQVEPQDRITKRQLVETTIAATGYARNAAGLVEGGVPGAVEGYVAGSTQGWTAAGQADQAGQAGHAGQAAQAQQGQTLAQG
ncbi:hypothetical protein INT45_012027 [Circinella minor]|uniref:Uncharacterized protein n=1 Tax=Circinella minor TaxID=1195481 RepID=A0A8H7SGI0_9FUNG|nr:hypothetical protein INT45_012027 [Circinella minor]